MLYFIFIRKKTWKSKKPSETSRYPCGTLAASRWLLHAFTKWLVNHLSDWYRSLEAFRCLYIKESQKSK